MSDGAPAARSALEDQRDFLLRSLDDLEREHEAGDVDERDYAALKDDYTARAAVVLRALDADLAAPPATGRRRPPVGRRVVVAFGVLAFAGLAGLLVAQGSGRRDSGDLPTGDVRRSVTEKLNEATQRLSQGDATGAVDLYDEVLAEQPANTEALTYRGWALYTFLGRQEEGLSSLLEAATADATYPDVHAFLAVVFFRTGLVEQASRELDRLEALDPPPAMLDLTKGLREQIDAVLATTTTTLAPTAP
jgi:tetratricopeptide (TPR) repeat protein